MKHDKLILSAYGSHNSTFVMFYQGRYWAVETERWLNSKNIGLCNYMPARNMQLVFDEITGWLLAQTDRTDVDVYLTGYINHVKPKFPYKQLVSVDHHSAHAACSFYQSPYQKALVVTFDGGGDASYFNIYLADRQKGITMVDKFDYDLGFPYMILSHWLEDIKKECLEIGNLVYAGKIMGLCSYGKIREEWMSHFHDFYDKFIYSGDSFIGGREASWSAVRKLMADIGIDDFDFETTRLSGQVAWDIAACSQLAFEEKFYKHARKHLDAHPDLPVCLAGGCALNVLLNTRLAKERNGKVFIPPNTNDCGIAAGQLLYYQAPEHPVDLTYAGLPMMDDNELGLYLQDRKFETIENITLADLATYIAKGFIVGFIQGGSEHGSRALGNRSIFCNPGIKDMKDILNEKVKHREWYRPFAPLVKIENTQTYFDFYGDNSRHMTFVADVKPEWREKLPSITHQDGTGRIQTITRWQNEAVYDLLTEFEKSAGHGVLLNTSFNDNGKPILTRYSDALNLLANTKLDAVYCHEKRLIIFKSGDEKRFNKSLQEEGTAQITLDTTVNVMAFAKDHIEMETKYLPVMERMARKTDRMVIVTTSEFARSLSEKFSSRPHVKVYSMDSTKHYYNSMVHKKIPTHPELNINSTYFFSLFVKPLWMKEVLRDNLFDTKYHLFIDLTYYSEDYNYNIVRDLKSLMAFAKEEDDVIGMTALKHRESIFTDEFMMERFKLKPELHPLPYIYYGNLDALNWFSTNYEGMFRWFFNEDMIGDTADYCLVSLAENKHRYKFLDLEKTVDEA